MQLNEEKRQDLIKVHRGVFIRKTLLDVLMILPQVHLRKPCYDFYFL